jgi:hypothetical protein
MGVRLSRASAPVRRTATQPESGPALPASRAWDAAPDAGLSAGAGHELADVSVHAPIQRAPGAVRKYEQLKPRQTKTGAERKTALANRRLATTLRRRRKKALNRLNLQQLRRSRPRRPRVARPA